MIYKILRNSEYLDLVVDGTSNGSPDDVRDGFIHFSTKEQLAGTLARHFEDEDELQLLAFDDRGMDGLKWEESRDGKLFPHLYGKLVLDDVVETHMLQGHYIPKDLGK